MVLALVCCLWTFQENGVSMRFIADQDFYMPVSVKVDQRDRIFVVDLREHHVLIFDNQGKPLKTIGGPGQGPGEFQNPGDVGFLPDGRFLVSDSGQRRVHLFDGEGRFLKVIKIVAQPVGKILVKADGTFLLSRSNGVNFNMDMNETEPKRFGIYNLDGLQLSSFGAMESDKNPLLQVMLNIGPISLWGDKVVMASLVRPVLTIYEGDTEHQVRYPVRFEPREPRSTMQEVEESDGSVSFRMSVQADQLCQAMTVLSEEAILLLRAVNNEDEEPTSQLVMLNWKGEILKVWPDEFRPQDMALSRDKKYAYIVNELEEEPVISRVAL